MPAHLYPLKRLDLELAALVFVCVLALYVRTLAPGLLLGDSAELQTLTYTLGMTHPTGYPVYLLATRLFSLLPLGSLAYRVNLFSAVLGALAMALLVLSGRILGGWRIAAVAGPLVLSVAPVFWWTAIMAELYAAAAALLSGIVVLVLVSRYTGNERFLFAAGLLGGLSLGVHGTVALAAPATLVYLLLSARRRAAWLAAICGTLAGAALAIAAFAAIDAHDVPSSYYHAAVWHALSVWHLTDADFESFFGRLRFLLTARQFQQAMFADPLERMPRNVHLYWQRLKDDFAPLGRGLMVLGGLALFTRGRWREAIWLTLAYATALVFVLNYDVFDIEVFYLSTYVLLAVFVSVGAATLLDAAAWILGRAGRASATAAVLGALVLAGLAWPAARSVRDAWGAGRITFLDHTNTGKYPYPVQTPAYPYTTAKALVDQLEDNAIVFANWDFLYAYYFVAHVEERRTSMAFRQAYPQEGVTSLADSTLDYIDANLATRPIYFVKEPDQSAYRRYQIVAVEKGSGVRVYQVLKRKQP